MRLKNRHNQPLLDARKANRVRVEVSQLDSQGTSVEEGSGFNQTKQGFVLTLENHRNGTYRAQLRAVAGAFRSVQGVGISVMVEVGASFPVLSAFLYAC